MVASGEGTRQLALFSDWDVTPPEPAAPPAADVDRPDAGLTPIVESLPDDEGDTDATPQGIEECGEPPLSVTPSSEDAAETAPAARVAPKADDAPEAPGAGPPADGRAAAIPDGARIVHLPLERIIDDDTQFMFRARMRFADLRDHLASEGQQVPAVVRPVPGTRPIRYQLISGFRRYSAIKSLGWPTLAAVIRHDLADDEAAFRASVAENVARKSYTDIDRAIVIRSYRDRGYAAKEVAALMGMTDRNRKMVMSLLEMPECVQQAVDTPEHTFKTKHAILLARLKSHHPEIDVAAWVERVGEERLSVDRMVRAVNREIKPSPPSGGAFTTLFQPRGTRPEVGEFWFAPTKVRVADLTREERDALTADLGRILAALAADPPPSDTKNARRP